jgi:hypothetical protein
MEKRPEKIIPWRRHHVRLDAAVRKQNSSCRHVEEDVDAKIVVLIFNGTVMEKTIPLFPFTVAGEEEEEIKLQYQEIWHEETLTVMTQSTREKLLKTMDSCSLQPRRHAGGEGRGTSGGGRWGAATALGQSRPTWNANKIKLNINPQK